MGRMGTVEMALNVFSKRTSEWFLQVVYRISEGTEADCRQVVFVSWDWDWDTALSSATRPPPA